MMPQKISEIINRIDLGEKGICFFDKKGRKIQVGKLDFDFNPYYFILHGKRVIRRKNLSLDKMKELINKSL